jgi:UDP-N-acetyl-2-amino-2-deoxyglucuronate dehydrogenase
MVMDVNPTVAEDLAKRHQAPYTTDVDELLSRDDVDAVLISVPHYLHAPLTIQAARHGKHVMVEKPMATSLSDADDMIAACQEAGVKLSVIYCQRYLPYVQKAKMLIEQGALGRLLGINLIHYLDKPVGYWTGGRTGRVATDWRTSREKSGGGILVFNLVHYLDLIRYLTGLEVSRVYGEFGTFDSPVETEDTISINLRYVNPQDSEDGQIIGNIAAASCVRGSILAHQQLRIWGTEGQIIVGEPFQFYSLHQVDDCNPGEWHTLSEWEWGVERREYVQQFANAVLRGEKPAIDGYDGRAVQAIVDAAYASHELQKPVEIEGVET